MRLCMASVACLRCGLWLPKPKAGRAKAEPKEAKAAAGSRASARERKAVDHFKVEDSRLKSDPVVIMEVCIQRRLQDHTPTFKAPGVCLISNQKSLG